MKDVFLNFHKSTKLIIKKRKKIFMELEWSLVVYFCHKVKRVPYQKKWDLSFMNFLSLYFNQKLKCCF